MSQLQSMLALKTRPPVLPPRLMQRPGLAERLTIAAVNPLTVVCAGPGAGKTLTTASWALSGLAGARVAWFSLDDSDDDPQSFWSNVFHALIASGGVPADSSIRDITPAAEFGKTELSQACDRLAELPAPVILVLDDFQEITNPAVIESVDWLIDRQLPTLRLVLLSRADPTLRLHRLRVQGKLTEIRAQDLAFTGGEIAELFATSGFRLRDDQIDVLRERTQGWPAGLRLAAMSLDPDDVDAGIERFSGSERSVAEYLSGEVTHRLSTADRDFLLRTSVVDRISAALAEHLTGRTDSQQTLDGFVAANAFVVGLGAGNEWFSYHPLLRGLLRHRLALEQPQTAAGLHRRAAEWATGHGAPIEAIRHWILAGDMQAAGRTMLTIIQQILSAEAPAFTAAIEPLARTAHDQPSLLTLLAAATYHLHHHDYVGMHRDAVEARGFLPGADEDTRSAAEAAIALFEMGAARFRGDSAATLRLAGRAVAVLDATPRHRLPNARYFRVIAEINLAGARLWTGNTGDAEQTLENAAIAAAEIGLLLPQLNATGHLALFDVLHGRCRRAARRSAEVLQIAERNGWTSEPQALAEYLSSGLVELARNRPDTAAGHLRKGLAATGTQTDRSLRLALGISTIQVAVSRHDLDAAISVDARVAEGLRRTPDAAELLTRWAAVAGAEALLLAGRPEQVHDRINAPGTETSFVSSAERVCLARARFAQDQLPAAEQLIRPLLKQVWPYREPAITAHLLQAAIADRQHRDSAAIAAASTAIELAEPENIRRPFTLIGSRLPELLLRYRHLDGPHVKFLNDLTGELTQAAGTSEVPIMVDHLTDREMTVLRYLPTMLKAGEIATDLYVSVNTVKAHLRSIYRKFGVATRREAVERARALGLL